MGGGNAQKSAMARLRKQEKDRASAKGSQLADNAKALSIKCKTCLQTFICTSTEQKLKEHAENKHPKNTFEECFPDFKK